MSLSLSLSEPPKWKWGRRGALPSEIKTQKAAELTREEEGRQSRVRASDLDQIRAFPVIPTIEADDLVPS